MYKKRDKVVSQSALHQGFKVGDVYKSTIATPYYKIVEVGGDWVAYIVYWADSSPTKYNFPSAWASGRLKRDLRQGTIYKVEPEELLTKILTGEIKS